MARVSLTLRWCAVLMALVVIFGACSISGTTSGATTGGPTPTPTPIPCATHASATAIVWAESQQIHGGINGAAPTTLSTFSYPLGLPDEGFEGNPTLPGFMAVSPDGHHIAVDQQVFVPFTNELYPYVVDTTTHAATRVTLPAYTLSPGMHTRHLAWADNHTLIVFQGATNRGGSSASATYAYDITSATASALPGVTGALEGVVRCNTLFYITVDGSFHEQLHRYDMTTHAAIGAPLALSSAANLSEGTIGLAGWDASRDGTRVAWQQATVSGDQVSSSVFMGANADGSGAAAVFTGPPPATSHSFSYLAFSSDGTKLALTNAEPVPSVASAPSTGGGGIRFYAPDILGWPVWLPDNSGFLAGKNFEDDQGDIYQFLLSTPLNGSGQAPGTEVHAAGGYPATLP
jgi:hypothetical protein